MAELDDKTPDPKEQDSKNSNKSEDTEARAALRYLHGIIQTQNEKMTQMAEQLGQRAEGKDSKAPAPKGEEGPSGDDLERMSRADLVQHITNSILTQARTEIIEPLNARMKEGEDKAERRGIQGEIDAAAKQYDDFYDHQKPMKEILDKHPSLSIDEAYQLARQQNPDLGKAKADEKAETAAEESKKEAETRSSEYGGLLPTSGRTAPNDKMSPEDAAEAAYAEIIEGTPHESMVQ